MECTPSGRCRALEEGGPGLLAGVGVQVTFSTLLLSPARQATVTESFIKLCLEIFPEREEESEGEESGEEIDIAVFLHEVESSPPSSSPVVVASPPASLPSITVGRGISLRATIRRLASPVILRRRHSDEGSSLGPDLGTQSPKDEIIRRSLRLRDRIVSALSPQRLSSTKDSLGPRALSFASMADSEESSADPGMDESFPGLICGIPFIDASTEMLDSLGSDEELAARLEEPGPSALGTISIIGSSVGASSTGGLRGSSVDSSSVMPGSIDSLGEPSLSLGSCSEASIPRSLPRPSLSPPPHPPPPTPLLFSSFTSEVIPRPPGLILYQDPGQTDLLRSPNISPSLRSEMWSPSLRSQTQSPSVRCGAPSPSLDSASLTPSLESVQLSPGPCSPQLGGGSKSPASPPDPVLRNFPLFFDDDEPKLKKKPKEKKRKPEKKIGSDKSTDEYKNTKAMKPKLSKLPVRLKGMSTESENGSERGEMREGRRVSGDLLGTLSEKELVLHARRPISPSGTSRGSVSPSSVRGAVSPCGARAPMSPSLRGSVSPGPRTPMSPGPRAVESPSRIRGAVSPCSEKGFRRGTELSASDRPHTRSPAGRAARRSLSPSLLPSAGSGSALSGYGRKVSPPLREPAVIEVEGEGCEPGCVTYQLQHFTYTSKAVGGER